MIELDMDQHDRSYLGKSMRVTRKRAESAKKSPEKTTKHSFKKVNPTDKYVAPVALVNLDEIGDYGNTVNDYGMTTKAPLEDHLRRKIEK